MEFPLYDLTSNGNCGFLGFRMCQNRLAVAIFSHLLETEGFGQVIELGTQLGGFSALLGLQCQMMGARFDTFDIQRDTLYPEWFLRFGIYYHIVDILSDAGTTLIRELIQTEKRVLLLCDNGSKVEEFRRFAPFLKSGDVIGAHDYHPDGVDNSRNWAWNEIGDRAVEPICQELGLVPFHQADFTESAWLMRVKT